LDFQIGFDVDILRFFCSAIFLATFCQISAIFFPIVWSHWVVRSQFLEEQSLLVMISWVCLLDLVDAEKLEYLI
jgi:hypothetical protein